MSLLNLDKKSRTQLRNVVEWGAREMRSDPRRGGQLNPASMTPVPALLTHHAPFASNGNRWKYTWSAAALATDDTVISATTGDVLFGTIANGKYAINWAEAANLATRTTQPDGVNQGAADYPPGWDIQPIGGGARTGEVACAVIVPVLLFPVWRPDGTVRMVFDRPNAHDGPCG